MRILVSNNPYRLGRALGSGTRPRLDAGVLGITVLAAGRSPAPANRRRLQMQQWTATGSRSLTGPVPAGVDGEALVFDPPVRFAMRPAALRVRIAPQHPGASPSAVMPDRPQQMLAALAALAFRGDLSSGSLARVAATTAITTPATPWMRVRPPAPWRRAQRRPLRRPGHPRGGVS